jgi:hypothetical protein
MRQRPVLHKGREYYGRKVEVADGVPAVVVEIVAGRRQVVEMVAARRQVGGRRLEVREARRQVAERRPVVVVVVVVGRQDVGHRRRHRQSRGCSLLINAFLKK